MSEQKTEYTGLSWFNVDTVSFLHSAARPETLCDAKDWQRKVRAARCFCVEQKGQTVLLQHADILPFSIWFFALASLGRHIVLAPNQRPETLQELTAQVDWVCPAWLPEPESMPVEAISFDPRCRLSFFTSGSSGKAKLVEKRLDQLTLEVERLHQVFAAQLPAGAVAAATVPPNHIYGLLFRLLWPLYAGLPVLSKSVEYREELDALVSRQQAVLLISTPAHLSRFDELDRLRDYGTKMMIFSSGGPLSPLVASQYESSLGQAPIEVFGSTETGGIAWRQGVDTWQTFPEVTLKLNPEGCLLVRSPYLHQTGWYQTQDRAVLQADGVFTLLGRADRIVKLAEKRLSLVEMETSLGRCSLVKEIALVHLRGRRDCLGAAVVLTESGADLLKQNGKLALNQSLREFLAQRYERVLLPRRFRYLESLPFNERGKLSSTVLEALFQ